MENQINTTPMSGTKVNMGKKKPALIACLSALAIVLLVGGIFIGRSTANNNETNSEDGETIATIRQRLEFAERNAESDQARINQLETELAEATGQEVPVLRSLEEQLQVAYAETGATGRIVDTFDMQNSPIAPFQTVRAGIGSTDGSLGGYSVLFWRNGTSGEWRFFSGTQNSFSCSRFSGLERPFAGFECYDDNNPGTNRIVGELWNLL